MHQLSKNLTFFNHQNINSSASSQHHCLASQRRVGDLPPFVLNNALKARFLAAIEVFSKMQCDSRKTLTQFLKLCPAWPQALHNIRKDPTLTEANTKSDWLPNPAKMHGLSIHVNSSAH